MLKDQKLHFISTELYQFLMKLFDSPSDIKIPLDFSAGEFEGSHLSWTKDRMSFCYIRKHRLNLYDLTNYDDVYNIEKRFEGSANATRIGKFRKAFANCGIILSQEAQTNLDAYFVKNITYKIIDNPSEVYSLDKSDFSGTLGSSCMQGENEDYFEMYDSEECFKLLVVYSNTQIVGRSLLINTDGKVYMDRRYGNNDNIQHAMQEYGLSQGWFVKSNNNYDDIQSWLHQNHSNADKQVYVNYPTAKDDWASCFNIS